MALFWWAWFISEGEGSEKREYLISGFGISILAIVVARLLALSLPYRERPFHNSLLHFQLPYTMNPSILVGWSSFPSDHAVVFCSLTLTLWMVSKSLGIAATLYTFFVVLFPRVYTGVHYPTDILAGALLGCGMASLIGIVRLRSGVAGFALRWGERYPGPFYAFFFLCTFELAELFDTVRTLSHPITRMIRPLLAMLR